MIVPRNLSVEDEECEKECDEAVAMDAEVHDEDAHIVVEVEDAMVVVEEEKEEEEAKEVVDPSMIAEPLTSKHFKISLYCCIYI